MAVGGRLVAESPRQSLLMEGDVPEQGTQALGPLEKEMDLMLP